MVLLDGVAAFLMGTLSGMGIGGGGLMVIYMVSVRAVSQHAAQGLNLYFFIFVSAAALFVHFRKRSIDPYKIIIPGVFGMPFALLGGLLAGEVSSEMLRGAFGIMLCGAGTISLLKALTEGRGKNKIEKK